jgi:hypothetical protein
LPLGEKPGAWTEKLEGIALCKWGYHFTDADHLWGWLSDRAFALEFAGEMLGDPGDDKYVAGQARLLRELPLNSPEVVGNTIGNIIEYLRAMLVIGDGLVATVDSLWIPGLLDFLQLAASIFQRRTFTPADRHEIKGILHNDIESLQDSDTYITLTAHNLTSCTDISKAIWYSLNTRMRVVVKAICRLLCVSFLYSLNGGNFRIPNLSLAVGDTLLIERVVDLLVEVLVVYNVPQPYNVVSRYNLGVVDSKVVTARLFTLEMSHILARQLFPDEHIPTLVNDVLLNTQPGPSLFTI